MVDTSLITKHDLRLALGHSRNHDYFFADRLEKFNVPVGFKPAAVVMPLFESQKEWHLLLTKRSDSLVEHKGQVAFPGGASEDGDKDLQWTALREMQEEIGIEPGDVEVLGHLGDLPTTTGYLVRVFVGIVPWPYDLKINHAEVESVFSIPLSWLDDPMNRSVNFRTFAGQELPIIYYDLYDGYQLWGLSADMTVALLRALGLRG